MFRCLSSTDDASDFFAGPGIRFRLSVNHEQDYIARHTDRLPSRLIRIWILTRRGVWIIEYEACRLEPETVSPPVRLVLLRVPSPMQCHSLM